MLTESPAAESAAITVAARGQAAPTPRVPATVLFLTDFGVKHGAVPLCKGVMWSIEPRLRVVDVTHQIPPTRHR